MVCRGTLILDAEGQLVRNAAGHGMRGADIEKVKQILSEVKPEQLQELLMYREKSDWDGVTRTPLDWCLDNEDEECVLTVTEHLIEKLADLHLLAIVFPYTPSVKSKDLSQIILEKFPGQSKNILQIAGGKGRRALHVACNSGNKDTALMLLSKMNECGILEEEILKYDNTGCLALSLAQAEKKKNYAFYDAIIETNASYQHRLETAKAMLEWIQTNAPDKVGKVNKR